MANLFSEVKQFVGRQFGGKPQISEGDRAMSIHEFTEAIAELGEVFGFSQADWLLAMEDRGYLTFNQERGQFGGALAERRRADLVVKSRAFWEADPLAKQAVRLWTDYGVGKGIEYQAQLPNDDDEEDVGDDDETSAGGSEVDTKTQAKLDKFVKYRKNKKLTSSKGQQRLSKKLLVDGEIFFAVFEGEPKILRTINPLQITSIITDPDDEEEVLCYKRETKGSPGKVLYYKDWAAEDEDLQGLKDPTDRKTITVEKDVVVYHLPFDEIDKRGNGLLFSVVEWSNAHRGFMKDRVAITRGLAKFASKVTVKGGQAAADAVRKRLESSLTQTGISGGVEKNPRTAPGSSFIQNEGIDLQAMPRTTGAGDAKEDGNALKLMHCAGTGTMLHYYGDPSTGNLATAEAMELPMLKAFAGYQELWKDFWRDLFSIVLDEDIDAEPATINIYLPRILAEDLVKLAQFVTALVQAFPEVKVPEVLRMLLGALGIDDLDEVMKAVAEKRKSIDENPPIPPAPAPGDPADPNRPPSNAAPQMTMSKEAMDCLNNFADTFKEVMAT